ncbi:hypothetical protein SCOR_35190 [Sulfidibacter corallicola]|uniref:Uncharacterized protein n=1 Tax=Sulfidibacter corallicola TaxID=2818388 RepID=A0A8A4TJ51_SULCO|nr:hypothetical protein [Sulfidibacter corallicola]QTD49224.1 hypothetical protein J3U87_26870 [Sulfidibacter corallicola]
MLELLRLVGLAAQPTAAPTLKKCGNSSLGEFDGCCAEKTVRFETMDGRMVALQALEEINGNPWTSVAELTILAEE